MTPAQLDELKAQLRDGTLDGVNGRLRTIDAITFLQSELAASKAREANLSGVVQREAVVALDRMEYVESLITERDQLTAANQALDVRNGELASANISYHFAALALLKYADHKARCRMNDDGVRCNCGFLGARSAALSPPAESQHREGAAP